jgi:hypothetical protein
MDTDLYSVARKQMSDLAGLAAKLSARLKAEQTHPDATINGVDLAKLIVRTDEMLKSLESIAKQLEAVLQAPVPLEVSECERIARELGVELIEAAKIRDECLKAPDKAAAYSKIKQARGK